MNDTVAAGHQFLDSLPVGEVADHHFFARTGRFHRDDVGQPKLFSHGGKAPAGDLAQSASGSGDQQSMQHRSSQLKRPGRVSDSAGT